MVATRRRAAVGQVTRNLDAGSTRVDADQISDRDRTIAATVDTVADELDVSSAQVALAWTMPPTPTSIRSSAHTATQLVDNLAAVELELPAEATERLRAASSIELGFPGDFLTSTAEFVYGTVGPRVDPRSPSPYG